MNKNTWITAAIVLLVVLASCLPASTSRVRDAASAKASIFVWLSEPIDSEKLQYTMVLSTPSAATNAGFCNPALKDCKVGATGYKGATLLGTQGGRKFWQFDAQVTLSEGLKITLQADSGDARTIVFNKIATGS